MPKQIQYIKDGLIVAQLDANLPQLSIPDHDSTNEVWLVPEQVTLWQFKQACAEKESPLPGFASLEQLIDYLIIQMEEGVPKQRALRAWTIANHIARSSATIEQLRGVVNQIANAEIMPVAYVDNLFIQAEQIEA